MGILQFFLVRDNITSPCKLVQNLESVSVPNYFKSIVAISLFGMVHHVICTGFANNKQVFIMICVRFCGKLLRQD